MSTTARTSALRAVRAAPLAGTRHRPLPITVGARDTLVLRRRVINAADGFYGPDTDTELGDERTVTAIPFSTWGNRAPARCGSGFRELLAGACNDGPRS